MGITANFDLSDIKAGFDNLLDEIQKMQIKILQELGERCVRHARSIPKEQGFEDQTGNLRSSIGYAVFVDGVAIHSVYDEVNGGTVGAKAGEALAQRIGEQTKGFCLVVTAGMNYAQYVESSGRDVITSAEQLAERELPRMLDELKRNVKQAVE